jgi:hypothetical protein
MPNVEQRLATAEAIAKAATAAIGAYAPLALMGIEGFKWLRAKLKDRGVLSEADVAEYEASMVEWQANIDRAQAAVDEFKRLRLAERPAPDPED